MFAQKAVPYFRDMGNTVLSINAVNKTSHLEGIQKWLFMKPVDGSTDLVSSHIQCYH